LIGTGFVLGATGAQASLGLVEFGVVGVLGVTIDVARIIPGCTEDVFDSFAVNKIDCFKAGLTISYDGC
jgi:hypothetical protein